VKAFERVSAAPDRTGCFKYKHVEFVADVRYEPPASPIIVSHDQSANQSGEMGSSRIGKTHWNAMALERNGNVICGSVPHDN
jgi:hypothetical protein